MPAVEVDEWRGQKLVVAFADSQENRLIGALPRDDLERWQPSLQEVDLPLGEVLYESGAVLSYVFFPTTAIVSLLYVMANGASAEIAVVGNEGLVGVSLFRYSRFRYSRGHITVLDRCGLEHRSCDCYAVVKKEYDRLLPDQLASLNSGVLIITTVR